MEFKEFDNPEQADYDIKTGTKVPTFIPPNDDYSLNSDEGIDLNDLGDETFSMPTFIPPNDDSSLNSDEGIDLNDLGDETFSMPQTSAANPNFFINKYGEIEREAPLLTVYNMPEDVLMQFSDNNYIWKVQRTETRNGNYASNISRQFTEIFRQDGDGTLRCQWSGSLIENSDAIKEDEIVIFSGDMDTNAIFKITMPLVDAPDEIANQLVEGRTR